MNDYFAYIHLLIYFEIEFYTVYECFSPILLPSLITIIIRMDSIVITIINFIVIITVIVTIMILIMMIKVIMIIMMIMMVIMK